MMKIIHCITGPTASGKSAYGIKLAQKLDGEIVNADALQVYSHLQVLSARPRLADMQDIPHHMFGHIDPSFHYSVGHWLREVNPLIIDILARGKTPILVGGTGLYFKALTEGLANIPALSEGVLEDAQTILDTRGIEYLRVQAEELDPKAAAKVLGNDPQRLLRIVSVAQGTGKPLSLWQEDTRPLIPAGSWKGMVILPKREHLYDRINARFADMIRVGGLREANEFEKLNLAANLPAMKAIGLKELIAHLRGEISLDEATELAMRQTRRFAKRQYTWFRGQLPGWELVNTMDII